MPLARNDMSPNTFRCMQLAAKLSAFLMPVQFATGCGGFHRRSPVGGAANGIPRSLGRLTLDQRVPTNNVGGMVQWVRAFGLKNVFSAGANFHFNSAPLFASH